MKPVDIVAQSTVCNEIRAKQIAYAARPYAVRWCDSHFSTTNRFNTLDEAHDYIQRMWSNIRDEVTRYPYRASQLWHSHLESPDGSRIKLRYVLLCDDVSSY